MSTVVRFSELGGPENLEFHEMPPQQPLKGEVRLRVLAAGLNRAEALFVRGQYLEQPKLPSRIGYEVAGVVEAPLAMASIRAGSARKSRPSPPIR